MVSVPTVVRSCARTRYWWSVCRAACSPGCTGAPGLRCTRSACVLQGPRRFRFGRMPAPWAVKAPQGCGANNRHS
eukprot:10324362-Alexandrium_andersonii.AAC.1